MTEPGNKSQLLRKAFLLFLLGAAIILLFETLERTGLITELTESSARLIVWVILVGVITVSARKNSITRDIQLCGSVCVIAIILSCVVEVTADIDRFDQVAMIGHESHIRHFIEKSLVSICICTGLLLTYLFVRHLEESHQLLERRVQERTRDLSAANRKLNRTECMVNTAAEGILTVGPDGRILEANQKMSERLGWTRDELLRMSIPDIDPDYPFDFWPEHWKGLRDDGHVVLESSHVTKAGDRIPVEVSINHFEFDGCEYVCSFVRDITERRRAADALRAANSQLENKVKERTRELEVAACELKAAQDHVVQRERMAALGQMASGIAHDLNNALMPVTVFADLLIEQPGLSADQQRFVKLIADGAQHVAGVVRGLQSFYRQSAPIDKLEVVDLGEMARQISTITRPKWFDEPQRAGREIKVRVETERGSHTRANANEIRQVLTNLIFNAVEAMPQGGRITIRTGQEDRWAFVEVHDGGVGMTTEQTSRCFEPFYTAKARGSGLGLSVCHGIVERHQGEMEIESSIGLGTRIRVRLPLFQPDQAPRKDQESIARSLERRRVLVIDDDASSRMSIKALLDSLALETDVATDGPSGLDLLGRRSYDFVITDIGMSGMNGIEVTQAIKSKQPETPVVIISGWSERELAERFGDSALVAKIIAKPIDRETVRTVLGSIP